MNTSFVEFRNTQAESNNQEKNTLSLEKKPTILTLLPSINQAKSLKNSIFFEKITYIQQKTEQNSWVRLSGQCVAEHSGMSKSSFYRSALSLKNSREIKIKQIRKSKTKLINFYQIKKQESSSKLYIFKDSLSTSTKLHTETRYQLAVIDFHLSLLTFSNNFSHFKGVNYSEITLNTISSLLSTNKETSLRILKKYCKEFKKLFLKKGNSYFIEIRELNDEERKLIKQLQKNQRTVSNESKLILKRDLKNKTKVDPTLGVNTKKTEKERLINKNYDLKTLERNHLNPILKEIYNSKLKNFLKRGGEFYGKIIFELEECIYTGFTLEKIKEGLERYTLLRKIGGLKFRPNAVLFIRNLRENSKYRKLLYKLSDEAINN